MTTPAPSIHKFYDHVEATTGLQEFNPNIEVDLRKQSGSYAYWNSLLTQAEFQLDKLKHAVELVEAQLDKEIRAELVKAGAKFTESQVRNEITLNPRMKQFQTLLREAKREVGFLKGTAIAWVQRKDTLLQIARNQLAEKSSNPVVYGQRQDKETRRGLASRFDTETYEDDTAVEAD